MNHPSYLSRTLWDYCSSSEYTDVTLFCADGSLPAHAAILAPLFSRYGIKFQSRVEGPDCIFLPDLTITEVKQTLKTLYLKNSVDQVKNILEDKINIESIQGRKHTNFLKSYSNTDAYSKNMNAFDKGNNFQLETVKSENPLDRKQVKAFPCNICSKIFSKGQDYRKHKYCAHEQKEDLIWEEWENLKKNIKEKQTEMADCKPKTIKTNVCEYCQKVVKYGGPGLKKHYVYNHREQLVLHHPNILPNKLCLECDIMFFGVWDLKNHLKKDHGKHRKCYTCGQEFSTNGECLKHMQLQHSDELEALGIPTGRKDKECPYCYKMFEKKLGLEKHIFYVHKNKRSLHPEIRGRTNCVECDTIYIDNIDLRKHKSNHHGEQVICPVCSKVRKNKSALKHHMFSHANEEHVCEICSSKLKSVSMLKRHHDNKHNAKIKPFVFCDQCSYKTDRNDKMLQKHILEVHSGVQYYCSHCGKSFSSDFRRKKHQLLHGEKTVPCIDCDKKFTSKGLLNAHIKHVHKKEKDKICPHCAEAFFLQESYQIHVLRHNDDRQFPCEICGKSFFTKRDMKRHIMSHTLPYHCDQCEKRYGSKSLLNEHVQMRHNGRKRECRFNCGWDAWYKRQCMNHEKSCSQNPVPGAPYTVAVGTASSLTMQNYIAKLKE